MCPFFKNKLKRCLKISYSFGENAYIWINSACALAKFSTPEYASFCSRDQLLNFSIPPKRIVPTNCTYMLPFSLVRHSTQIVAQSRYSNFDLDLMLKLKKNVDSPQRRKQWDLSWLKAGDALTVGAIFNLATHSFSECIIKYCPLSSLKAIFYVYFYGFSFVHILLSRLTKYFVVKYSHNSRYFGRRKNH